MKVKEMFRYMKRFYKMLQQDHPTILIWIVLGGLAAGILPFISLFFSSRILDALIRSDMEQAIRQISFLLFGNLIVGCVDRICVQAVTVMADVGGNSVRKQTTNKAFIMEFEKYERTETMEKIRRAKNMEGNWGIAWQIRNSRYIIGCVVSVLFSVVFTAQLLLKACKKPIFILHTGILLLSFLGLMKGMNFIQEKAAKRKAETSREDEKFDAAAGAIWDDSLNVQNGKDIRLYKMQDLIYGWHTKIVKESNALVSRAYTYEAVGNGCIAMLCQVFAAVTFIYTGLGVLEGMISIGEVVLYTGTIATMTDRINETIGIYNYMAHQFAYLGDFEEFINSPSMNYDGTLPVEKRDDYIYELEFRNVSFKYPDTEIYALKDVNLKLKIGKRLAIVGQNGAGKTTLIKLLCRLYEPTEGEILLNGVNIDFYDYEEYTSLFSVVFQDFRLFALALDENIAGSTEVNEEQCWKVLNDVGMKETVESWPLKEHTLLYKNLGEGINVSGGEAQKIAIARALYKDAPVVIMDEPTAALDPIAEAEIYETFNDLIDQKTAIFISHRMSSCKFCDEILVLEDGRITQQGSHHKLVQEEGLYQQLWNAQAQYYA